MELFAERGFHATSTSKVATQAGVSEGTIFYYFKNKEGILVELLERVVGEYLQELKRVGAEAATGLAALEAMIELHFAMARDKASLITLLVRDFPASLSTGISPRSQAMNAQVAAINEVFAQALRRGQRDGSVRPCPVRPGPFTRRLSVNNAPRLESLDSWALKSGLALMLAGAVWWLWPRLSLPMLGREEVWFSLAWLLLLASPVAFEARRTRIPAGGDSADEPTLPDPFYERGAFLLGLVFLGALLAGGGLGNYKLWLGVIYLVAVNLRLAGLTLGLRGRFGGRAEDDPLPLLAASAISFLACLLIIPWVRPELCAVWPPPLKPLGLSLTSALLWGAIAGAAPLAVRVWGAGRRAAWLTYLAVGLGPGPALAVGVLTLWQLSLGSLGLAALILIRMFMRRSQPISLTGDQPVPLYWLLRALLLLWWGVGVALTLAAAWWQPRVQGLVTESLWLRAVGLGAFLVACLGLLAEYSLPLLGQPSLMRHTGQRKTLGLIMTALAVLASLTPLFIMRTEATPPAPAFLAERPRAELLPAPVSLSPANPEVTLSAPLWLTRVSHIFVVSLLSSAAEVDQSEPVAQLVVTDDQDIPHIYNLRAGVDSAEWALGKRDVAAIARHASARPAHGWMVYAPTGEAFMAYDYFTGLFLGSEVNRVKTVSLRYLYRNPPGRVPVTLDLKRVFLN